MHPTMHTVSTDLSTPPQRRHWAARWLWKTWFPAADAPQGTSAGRALGLLMSQFGAQVSGRRQRQQLNAPVLPIPVIAVGNALIGGAGKTPACIAILEALRSAGKSVGLVSRGYGITPQLQASMPVRTLLPDESAAPFWIGDEAWLIQQRLGVPVASHPDRHLAGMALLQRAPELDAIVLDDGLSQTSLRPSMRVLVLDERLTGNGLCLPAGPNRFPWPPPEVAAPDFVLVRGAPPPEALRRLLAQLPRTPQVEILPMRPVGWTSQARSCSPAGLLELAQSPSPKVIWAVAGIAEPSRFFSALRAMGFSCDVALALDDHAPDPWSSLQAFRGDRPWPDLILTTEKDWGKLICTGSDVPLDRVWALRLDHSLGEAWTRALLGRLQSTHGPQSA